MTLFGAIPAKNTEINWGTSGENLIMVEGMLNRSGSDSKTMTQITDIVELPDVSKGGGGRLSVYRRDLHRKTISAVEAVRKVRDGEA